MESLINAQTVQKKKSIMVAGWSESNIYHTGVITFISDSSFITA